MPFLQNLSSSLRSEIYMKSSVCKSCLFLINAALIKHWFQIVSPLLIPALHPGSQTKESEASALLSQRTDFCFVSGC